MCGWCDGVTHAINTLRWCIAAHGTMVWCCGIFGVAVTQCSQLHFLPPSTQISSHTQRRSLIICLLFGFKMQNELSCRPCARCQLLCCALLSCATRRSHKHLFTPRCSFQAVPQKKNPSGGRTSVTQRMSLICSRCELLTVPITCC